MSTVDKKTLFPIMLAFTALLSVPQQAAAQTPIAESKMPALPLDAIQPPPTPGDAKTRKYGCSLGAYGYITAKVSYWYASGKDYARVEEVETVRSNVAASASLTIEATGATSQTHSGIPLDGNTHHSTIFVAGTSGPRLSALTERPLVLGCNLSALEP